MYFIIYNNFKIFNKEMFGDLGGVYFSVSDILFLE